jgi:hypothetical protein
MLGKKAFAGTRHRFLSEARYLDEAGETPFESLNTIYDSIDLLRSDSGRKIRFPSVAIG